MFKHQFRVLVRTEYLQFADRRKTWNLAFAPPLSTSRWSHQYPEVWDWDFLQCLVTITVSKTNTDGEQFTRSLGKSRNLSEEITEFCSCSVFCTSVGHLKICRYLVYCRPSCFSQPCLSVLCQVSSDQMPVATWDSFSSNLGTIYLASDCVAS